MKNDIIEYEFCMSQFKLAIVGIAILLVIVMGWTAYHCTTIPHMRDFRVAAAVQPSASPIKLKDKMLHPYWGNCNQCHVTVDPPGKPISQVMAAGPISIKDKMLHDYWGNCLLCHKVTDGFQAPAGNGGQANTQGNNTQPQAMVAAFNQFSPQSIGLTLQPVTAAMMAQMGLAKEDGLLITDVAPGSAADAAGLKKGDEIIRVDKLRQEALSNFDSALSSHKAGSTVKMTIYSGSRNRTIYLKLPVFSSADGASPNGALAAATVPMTQNQVETLAEQLGMPKTQQAVTQALNKGTSQNGQQQGGTPSAVSPPMTQNQVETLAEQLGVPKTAQAVNQALQAQQQKQQSQQGAQQAQQGKVVANLNFGKVAVASTGPGLIYQVAAQFENSPYFVVFDPTLNSYSVTTNPNVNDLFGQGVQTAQYMVDLGVSNVVAGSFTQDAINTFHVLRVNVYPGLTGSVQNVLGSYTAGYLMPSMLTVPSGIPLQTGGVQSNQMGMQPNQTGMTLY